MSLVQSNMDRELFTVILYSYRRPELTKNAIDRIGAWPRLGRLFVSIDGERTNCSDEEKSWRKQVIDIAESAAENNPKVNPVIWEINYGTTAHAVRIMGKVLEEKESFLAIEEDNLILNEGLDFLANGLLDSKGPFISTAFSSSHHSSSTATSRYTFFPEQWTTALNREIFEAFEKVWNDKVIDRDVITRNFSTIFKSNPFYSRIVTEKWLSIFRRSAEVPNYGDALVTYAALTLNTPYLVPMNSLVRDLGSTDDRGMNPRGVLELTKGHLPSNMKVNDLMFCKTCEHSTNGIKGFGISQTTRALSRRILDLSRLSD